MCAWNLQRKVTVLACGSFALSLIAVGASFLGIQQLQQALTEVVTTASALRNHMTGDMMHDALRSDALAAQLAKDDADRRQVREDMREHAAIFEKALAENAKLKLPVEIQRAIQASREPLERYIGSARQVVAEADPAAAERRMPAFNESFEALEKANSDLSDKIEASAGAAHSGAEARVQSARVVLLVFIAVICGFNGYMIWMLRRLVGQLRDKLIRLADGSSRAAAAAVQLSSDSQSVLDTANQQDQSLNTTAQAASEIRQAAANNSTASEEAARFVSRSQGQVLEANRRLEEMVVAIGEVRGSSTEISRIIRVIEEIAFQTNILALNAAVEAARAGQAGAGFAVVADEVRRLAGRCSEAAQETAVLIERSMREAAQGESKVMLAAESIQNVTNEALEIKRLVDQLNSGSAAQSVGVTHVAQLVDAMGRVNHQSAAVMQQTANAAGQLHREAELLKQLCDELAVFTSAC